MRDRLRTWVALAAVLATAAVVVGVDRVVPAPSEDPSTPTTPPAEAAAFDPVAGSWVCGVGTGGAGRLATLVLAQPEPAPEDGADDVDADASATTSDDADEPGAGSDDAGTTTDIEVERFAEGNRRVHSLEPLTPAADERITFRSQEPDLSAGVVRWRGQPTAVWREWNLEDDGDLPDATIAGPCPAPSSPSWTVPGLSTQGGDEARLRMANPFSTAATFAVSFLTPDGEVAPLVLENLTVPAASVREIVVDEFLPEEPDLAAVINVVSGRLSAEGFQVAREAIGEVDGASLLAAAPASAEQWTVPWISDTPAASSWLWIANPTDRPATVELTLHTADGGVVPTGLAEAGVPGGQLRRVDLTGTLPDNVNVVAVTARSNGVPVVVSAGTRQTFEDVARTGLTVQLGVPDADDQWVVAGTGRYERMEELHVVNPSGEPAQVDISLVLGDEVSEPAALQNIAVGAGSSQTVPLTSEVGDAGWTAFVTATEGEVVVGRVARTPADAGPLRFVAAPGQPSSSWRAADSGLTADAAGLLARQLRTALGLGEHR